MRRLSFALIACLVLSQVSSQIVAQENSTGIQVTPDTPANVAVPEQVDPNTTQPQQVPAVPTREPGIHVTPQSDNAYLYANKEQEDFARATQRFEAAAQAGVLGEPIPKGKARVSCIEASVDFQKPLDPNNEFGRTSFRRFEASLHFFGDNEFWMAPFEQIPGEMTPEALELRHKEVLSQLQQQRGQLREKAVANGIYAMASDINEHSPYHLQSQLAANEILLVHFQLELNRSQQRSGVFLGGQQNYSEDQIRDFLRGGQIDQSRLNQAWETMRRELGERYPDKRFLSKFLPAIGEVNRPLDNQLRARALAALESKIYEQTQFVKGPNGSYLMQKTVRARGQILSETYCW